MKKIFTLICGALMAFTASAQLEVSVNGQVIKEGETVEFQAEEIPLGPGFSIVQCEPQEPKITNTTGAPLEVTLTVEKVNEKDNISICAFGGCAEIKGKVGEKTGKIESGNFANTEIHAYFESGKYVTYETKVTITAGSYKFSYIQKFVYADPTGIEATSADQVTVANNQLSYHFADNASRQLNIYGVSGRLVKSESLSQHGVVALNDLYRGVYIYEITKNGKRTATHKFVVK